MDECCSATGRGALRRSCPGNGLAGREVSPRTIAHHIVEPWAWTAGATRYYFCEDPACEIVYFGDDGSTVPRSRLREFSTAGDRLLCHCFGLTLDEFLRHPATRDYVVAQTRAGQCSCETRNPSGRCCLKDFPDIGERQR